MNKWKNLKVSFCLLELFSGVQSFSNLSVTSWDAELSFFPLPAVCSTKYWITYFPPHISTAFLVSAYKILNYLLFPPAFSLLFPHVCPPVLQGQISVLRAVCFSTARTISLSIKCCVLATGSEEEVGKENGRLGGIWATLLKCGRCLGWPGSFWALIPDVFSRAVLVHCSISWFHNSSSLWHPFHWSGDWGMEQKTHFSEYFVNSAAHCDQ